MTGSVDQHGGVQAIGGVNQKTEGFFDTCAGRGFTGTQGVIIPESNIRNLMLAARVRRAVRTGTFRIFGVDSVDQALELLTIMPAGAPDAGGRFPPDSVNGRVQAALTGFALIAARYASPGSSNGALHAETIAIGESVQGRRG